MGIFSGRHFPRDIILWAVRWYCRYGVSYRDLEEMMTERGVPVDHTTIYRWVQKYAPELDKHTRWYRQVPDWQAQSWRGWMRPISGSAARGAISTGLLPPVGRP